MYVGSGVFVGTGVRVARGVGVGVGRGVRVGVGACVYVGWAVYVGREVHAGRGVSEAGMGISDCAGVFAVAGVATAGRNAVGAASPSQAAIATARDSATNAKTQRAGEHAEVKQ